MLSELTIAKRILRHLICGQRGSTLVGILCAIGLFGLVATAVLNGVQTSSTAKSLFDTQSTAENIVRNQMEYVFEQPYQPPPGTYLTTTPPAGYSVTAEALVYEETNTDIETVRVTVYKEGQQVKVLETLRCNR